MDCGFPSIIEWSVDEKMVVHYQVYSHYDIGFIASSSLQMSKTCAQQALSGHINELLTGDDEACNNGVIGEQWNVQVKYNSPLHSGRCSVCACGRGITEAVVSVLFYFSR